ncbi:MAG TPA: hypothetical protein VNS55_04830 [Nocardioides sp.]|nr:hypothetical protein [Nocardioides sp.]
MTTGNEDEVERRRRHTAGAFDIRNVIGALMGIYGVVLAVMGVASDDTGPQTGDLHANLWAGLVLVAVAVVFVTWARLRPVVVDEKAVAEARAEEDRDAA